MNPFRYIREKGVTRALQVLWRYKLPRFQVRVVATILKRAKLADTLVIESHNGFDSNGGALFDWLIANGYNKKLKIVWRVESRYKNQLPPNVYQVPLYGPSWRKAVSICTAKWLSADCVVADKVRDDQVSLYMTHGAFGLKEAHGLLEVPSSVDYFLGLSPAMDDYLGWEYGLDGSHTTIVHVGYPELDKLYQNRDLTREKATSLSRKKTILWMPTFRKGTAYGRNDSDAIYPYGIPLITSRKQLETLSSVLSEADVRLIIKLHPRQDLSGITSDMPEGIELLSGRAVQAASYDNYDLMLDADAMISDYSSAVYQYLVLNRPVAFALADSDEYKLGLVNNAQKYMPGQVIMQFDQLLDFVREIGSGDDAFHDERSAFLDWFYEPNEGGACERVATLLGLPRL